MYRQGSCYAGKTNKFWTLCVNSKFLSVCLLVLFVEQISGRLDLTITLTAITIATATANTSSSTSTTTTTPSANVTTTTTTTTTASTNVTTNATTTTDRSTTTTEKPPRDNFVSFLEIHYNPLGYMRFCDTYAPVYDDDDICHGVAGILAHGDDEALGTGNIIASGIFIDNKHILTSYSPFRNLRTYVNRSKIYVNYLSEKVYGTGHLIGYYINRTNILCARQVVAMEDKDIVDEQWHGKGRTHTPLHDLMVMQTNETIMFINHTGEDEKRSVDLPMSGMNTFTSFFVGPLKYGLASLEDEFPFKFKIVSLGLMDNDHVFNKNHLHTTREYEFDERIVEDCEEWFPRDWGYFFCIKNDEDFVGIGSGAVLVNSDRDQHPVNEKPETPNPKKRRAPYYMVFGIGSFMLKKGKDSILVFTDVRPYSKAINMTCSEWDGNPN